LSNLTITLIAIPTFVVGLLLGLFILALCKLIIRKKCLKKDENKGIELLKMDIIKSFGENSDSL
jgi:hypothetical protein